MCTAISDTLSRHLFGRTLDLECSYGESAVITPRRFPLKFLRENTLYKHHAIIGIAHVCDGIPLYYDAANEAGLAIAALNFPDCAVYHPLKSDKNNIASFELIPWILGSCESVNEAVELLKNTNILPNSFSEQLPATPLHWLIADRRRAIAVESVSTGLEIYENPFGVLTNAPAFTYHTLNMSNYMRVDASHPENRIYPQAEISPYSRGMGAFGLPGDFSSSSRFVRAVFAKAHTVRGNGSDEVTRFFHVMDTVSQPLGCALTEDGRPISTVYTSCADTERGVYYFTTYANRRIRTLNLSHADINSATLTVVPIDKAEDTEWLN